MSPGPHFAKMTRSRTLKVKIIPTTGAIGNKLPREKADVFKCFSTVSPLCYLGHGKERGTFSGQLVDSSSSHIQADSRGWISIEL